MVQTPLIEQKPVQIPAQAQEEVIEQAVPVAPVIPVAPAEIVVEKKDVYILANSLNVRSTPSLEAVRVGAARMGQKYEYVQENEDWVEIRLSPTLTGWVFKQYVSISTR